MPNYNSAYSGAQVDAGVGYGILWNTNKIVAATKGIFYQNVAPTTWTIQNTLDDKLLFITKGSGAGGQTGGGVHSTGSWTLSGLTVDAHTHTTTIPINGYGGSAAEGPLSGYMQTDNGGNIFYATTQPTAVSGNASANTITSAGAWRPAAYCAIIAAKDAY